MRVRAPSRSASAMESDATMPRATGVARGIVASPTHVRLGRRRRHLLDSRVGGEQFVIADGHQQPRGEQHRR